MSEKKDIDLKKINQLIDLMIDKDLVELEIVDGNNKVHLKRPSPVQPTITQIPMPHPAVESVKSAKTETEDDGLVDIESPIVGTFYSSPSPDSDPFVSIGSKVKQDTVVCIIEAMKVMNEIKAETSGTIVEIVCKTGQAVEFGEILFKVKPD